MQTSSRVIYRRPKIKNKEPMMFRELFEATDGKIDIYNLGGIGDDVKSKDDLARAIYDALKKTGAEIGSAAIPIINVVLDKVDLNALKESKTEHVSEGSGRLAGKVIDEEFGVRLLEHLMTDGSKTYDVEVHSAFPCESEKEATMAYNHVVALVKAHHGYAIEESLERPGKLK
jgi:hypothetical protein